MGRERRKFDKTDCKTIKEKQFYFPCILPKMHSESAHIAPVVLVTPLFTIQRAKKGEKLPVVDKVFFRKGRGFVRYKGPTLTQSHQTVLLTLVNCTAAGLVDTERSFHPSEMLRKMGWSDNAGNIIRLRELLDDLWQGELYLWDEGKTEESNALRVRFIREWQPSDDGNWELQLSTRLMPLFDGSLSYVNMPTRAGLREGMATFLYGFICAESCALPVTYAELHAASGSQAKDLSQFALDVRTQLDAFKSDGFIADFRQHRGSVNILKR